MILFLTCMNFCIYIYIYTHFKLHGPQDILSLRLFLFLYIIEILDISFRAVFNRINRI
jgi:hypothetical protein